jgi:uncharacterized protein YkwD
MKKYLQNRVIMRINKITAGVIAIIIAGLFVCHDSQGQTQPEYQWSDSLSTAKNADYLTETEKEVIFELNKVRANPQEYVRYVKEERSYYDGRMIKKPGEVAIMTNEGVSAVDECIVALKKSRPVGIMYPHEGLYKSAALLARDQAKSGKTSHQMSDGVSMKSRLKRYVKQFMTAGENICYGTGDARDIVIRLLIDDGVPSRGHRNNILNNSYNSCGAAIDAHQVYQQVCVIDFGKINITQ